MQPALQRPPLNRLLEALPDSQLQVLHSMLDLARLLHHYTLALINQIAQMLGVRRQTVLIAASR